MLDVSREHATLRTATAEATIILLPTTLDLIHRHAIPKGDPLEVARVAGIQAAKHTPQIIPFAHPVPIDFAGITFALGDDEIVVTATVKAVCKAGVEMEAITAATVAALTLIDMLKLLDDTLTLTRVRLAGKPSARAEVRHLYPAPLRAAVLVSSDSVAAGSRQDLSGPLIRARLTDEGFKVEDYKVIPDDSLRMIEALTRYADTLKLDLVITTGGTGFSARDHTPEVMARVLEREIPGIPELLRGYSQIRTPYSMLMRGKAGVRGQTLIINLPGTKRGAAEALDALFPGLLYSFRKLKGGAHPEDIARPQDID